MKTIRNLAGVLLLITGILHIVLFLQTPDDPGIIGVLVFGIIYSIIGLLLFKNVLEFIKKYNSVAPVEIKMAFDLSW